MARRILDLAVRLGSFCEKSHEWSRVNDGSDYEDGVIDGRPIPMGLVEGDRHLCDMCAAKRCPLEGAQA